MSKRIYTNQEIKDFIMEIASKISDDFVWSNKLRRKFERITSFLSSH
jgi:hypothetical protein